MDQDVYLNDRPYRICDIGEGDCMLVLTNAEGIESLYETYSNRYLELERMIVIDTSLAWQKPLHELTKRESYGLASDIHLLADIYWLDEIKIEVESLGSYLNEILEKEFSPREIITNLP
ncbi:hypothetical protein [Vibrio mexicanus]|uniref:hypothetical protein n=1 Tax=Vibrio mexicanus TaxID=1004326 RepID=UPI0009497883|nr:hypothetical protein [Vibrio mexicanus]